MSDIRHEAAAGRRLVIVDVPLWFETGGEANIDLMVVVSAPDSIQRARALRRTGMTEIILFRPADMGHQIVAVALPAHDRGEQPRERAGPIRAHGVSEAGGLSGILCVRP